MKNRKSLIALVSIFGILLVGITIAYFTSIIDIENIFKTKQYGTTVTEKFESPDNWLPGQTTEKVVYAENTGEIDEAVRISYTEKWISANGEELSGLIDANGNVTNSTENSERAAILNLENEEYWIKDGDYYYYKYKISPGDVTGIFMNSVTFNKKVDADSPCGDQQIIDNNVLVYCDSTGNGYDDATYILTFNIETVQYDKYKEAWNTDLDIENQKYINELPVNSIVAKVTEVNQTKLFTFNHQATEQTPALTDYRYIGSNPNNYIYFNCNDLNNQNRKSCEIWRIIGVFEVENGNGNFEKRIKIVKNDQLSEEMQWDENGGNNWNTSTLMTYLNENYFLNLSENSQNMVEDAKYYLGGHNINYVSHEGSGPYGSAEENYIWERGKNVFDPYNSEYCNWYQIGSGNCTGRNINWIGKIGLLYPSDNFYIYSMGFNDKCFGNSYYCTGQNAKNGWLYDNIYFASNDYESWFISPVSDTYWNPFNFYYAGNLNGMYGAAGYATIYPTLYLKSNIHIKGGNGSVDEPYQLSFVQKSLINIINFDYETYKFGQEVLYDGEKYYVLKDSDSKKSYVTLLRNNLLSASEINEYSEDYISIDGEYPYLEDSSCNAESSYNCTTHYKKSNVKKIIDKWSSKYDDNLVMENGLVARLVTLEEVKKLFKYDNQSTFIGTYEYHTYSVGENTYRWAYFDDKVYWSMISYSDSPSIGYGIGNILSEEQVYNKLYIRPVINLKKCAIDNSCQ